MPQTIYNMSRDQAETELADIRGKLSTAFAEMGDAYDASKIKVFAGDTASKSRQLRTMNDRASELADHVKRLDNKPVGRGIAPGSYDTDESGLSTKSFGARISESGAFDTPGVTTVREVPFSAVELKGLESKSDFLTSAGWAPQSIRSGDLALAATRPVAVTDLIPTTNTDQASYVWMEESTFTNNAAEAAEAAQFAEGALALTERTMPISKIAVFLPVSDEQMADVRQASAYVDARLPFMLRQRLDLELLTGNGTPPNIKGFHNVSGLQTQAKGGDPIFDAVYKAVTLISQNAFSNADALVINPADWQGIRLTRTADGLYILGAPNSDVARSLFGLKVVVTPAITAGTILVGAFAEQSVLVQRQSVEIKVSDSHSDYFIHGKSAIRATMRAALVVYKGAAFCEVTGV